MGTIAALRVFGASTDSCIVMLSIMLRDADPVGSDRSDRIDRIGYGSGGEGEQNASRYQILVGW